MLDTDRGEPRHWELAKFANRRKHCVEKTTDITVSIAYIPLRNQRRRYRCRGAWTLESDLWMVRDPTKKVIITSITYHRNIGAKVKTRQLFVPRVSIWLFRPGKQQSDP